MSGTRIMGIKGLNLVCPEERAPGERCRGKLRVTMQSQIILRNVDGTIAYVYEKPSDPNAAQFIVSCRACGWTKGGTWKEIADRFGLVVAKRPA